MNPTPPTPRWTDALARAWNFLRYEGWPHRAFWWRFALDNLFHHQGWDKLWPWRLYCDYFDKWMMDE